MINKVTFETEEVPTSVIAWFSSGNGHTVPFEVTSQEHHESNFRKRSCKERIREFVEKEKVYTSKDISEALDINRNTVSCELSKLVKEGYMERVYRNGLPLEEGEQSHGYFKLKDKVGNKEEHGYYKERTKKEYDPFKEKVKEEILYVLKTFFASNTLGRIINVVREKKGGALRHFQGKIDELFPIAMEMVEEGKLVYRGEHHFGLSEEEYRKGILK